MRLTRSRRAWHISSSHGLRVLLPTAALWALGFTPGPNSFFQITNILTSTSDIGLFYSSVDNIAMSRPGHRPAPLSLVRPIYRLPAAPPPFSYPSPLCLGTRTCSSTPSPGVTPQVRVDPGHVPACLYRVLAPCSLLESCDFNARLQALVQKTLLA